MYKIIPGTEFITNKNIVLDIDETLVYSHEEVDNLVKLGLFTNNKLMYLRSRVYVLDLEDGAMWGVIRPHAEEFLGFCADYFDKVIIWSAGTEDYVKKIVKFLFKDLRKPDLIYTREDCDFENEEPRFKPLSKLMKQEPWLNLTEKNTLFVDDRSHTFKFNEKNAIHIPEFDPSVKDKIYLKKLDANDNCLMDIIEWLSTDEVVSCTDVRQLDKSKIFKKN